MIAVVLASGLVMSSCGSKRDPGRIYMPDMTYSRAYETYGYNNINDYERLRDSGVHYNARPVAGTRARGEMTDYYLTADSNGLRKAQGISNPFTGITPEQMMEGERLYLIHCGICHGSKLDGNGPIYDGGNGPYPAAPRPLNGEYAINLTDGHIFHVITYGKGVMGAYGGQVKPEERWWIVSYIRSKQAGTGGSADSATNTTDTTQAQVGTPAQGSGN